MTNSSGSVLSTGPSTGSRPSSSSSPPIAPPSFFQASDLLKNAKNEKDLLPKLETLLGRVKLIDFGSAVIDVDKTTDLKPEDRHVLQGLDYVVLQQGLDYAKEYQAATSGAENASAGSTSIGVAKLETCTIGTTHFLAPEIVKSSRRTESGAITASPASDIYALGGTIYQLIFGIPPFFAGSDFFSLLRKGKEGHKVVEGTEGQKRAGTETEIMMEPKFPLQIESDLDRKLAKLTMSLMSPQKENRPSIDLIIKDCDRNWSDLDFMLEGFTSGVFTCWTKLRVAQASEESEYGSEPGSKSWFEKVELFFGILEGKLAALKELEGKTDTDPEGETWRKSLLCSDPEVGAFFAKLVGDTSQGHSIKSFKLREYQIQHILYVNRDGAGPTPSLTDYLGGGGGDSDQDEEDGDDD